jgi:RHS repeat-associated protein
MIQAENAPWGASTYLYDPLGERKEKSVAGVATDFVLAGGEEIADYYETSATWRLMVRGAGGLPLAAIVPVAGGGSEEIDYVHHDVKGSTVALTAPGGSGVADSYTYSDYGGPQSGSWLAYQYAGYRYDSETSLDFVRARSYSPALGRFLQADPSGFQGGFNLYAYAGNDPVNLVDPTGLTPDGGNAVTVGQTATVPTYFMGVLGIPTVDISTTATAAAPNNPCSENGPNIVRDASVNALSRLNPGQDESTNITPRDGNFANVLNPSLINTTSWANAASAHGSSRQSPTIPGQSTFVVKLYSDPQRGNIIAVVYPNGTLQHLGGLIPFLAGSTNVNVPAARAYMGCHD